MLFKNNVAKIVAEGIFFANGVALDAEEKYVFVAETMKRRVLRYPIAQDDSLGTPEVYGPTFLGKLGFPDGIAFDGQGIAHPRKLGLASHLGVLLDLPTIGCAKSVLVGEWEWPAERRGASSPLIYRGEVVGDVLRTKDHVNPLFISPGHKVGRKTACEIVLSCCRRYRLPEPTRQAHIHVNRMRSTRHT